MVKTDWLRLLGYVTGLVNQELLLKNEYLVAENRILRAQIKGRLLLSDNEKATLAEIAKRVGRKALAQIGCVAKPDTILAWYRKLIAKKFDGSKRRVSRGRPPVGQELEDLVVELARNNASWGYDRIVGALDNLGHSISDQTVGNILRRRGVPPAPERGESTPWKDFIRSHMSVLAGTDFFTAEVLTWRGLVTYYVLFFIHLDSRRVSIAGITEHPDSAWMEQMARNVTAEGWGFLEGRRYLLHDRDAKFSDSFRDTVMAGGTKPLKLPARSPNLNSFAERWVRSVKEECLSKLVLFGGGSLRRAVGEYLTHFLAERNHQRWETCCCFHAARNSSASIKEPCAAKSDWAAS